MSTSLTFTISPRLRQVRWKQARPPETRKTEGKKKKIMVTRRSNKRRLVEMNHQYALLSFGARKEAKKRWEGGGDNS